MVSHGLFRPVLMVCQTGFVQPLLPLLLHPAVARISGFSPISLQDSLYIQYTSLRITIQL